MRIAMVTSAFPNSLDKLSGGIEAVTASVVSGILAVRPDVEMHVLRLVGAGDEPAEPDSFPGYTVHDVPFRRGAIGLLPGSLPIGRIHRALDSLHPDIVHVQARPTLVDGRRYPSVLTVHGISERDTLFADHRLRRLRSWVLKRKLFPARARFSHIIAPVGYVRQQLETYCSGRFHFIPNPSDAHCFEYSRKESGPIAFFAGRFRPIKNIHGLIEAFSILTREGVEADLHLVGPRHNDAYSARIDELVTRHDMADRIVFLGHLDRQRFMGELSRARCVVLPSFQESSPMILPEAAAAGVCAVASPVGGVAELVCHEHSGMMVDPASPASIAAGLRPLMESAELADTLGQRARSWAERVRPEVVGEKTLAVYERIIADWRSRGGGGAISCGPGLTGLGRRLES